MTQPNDWRSLYPFASHFLTIEGHRYHYLDEGSGPVLLLVHGNPTWSFFWREMVLKLRDRYRLIVPDHIGLGLSDKPAAGRYPYRLAQRVLDLARLVDELKLDDITLVAHDWGGAIGMGTAVSMPERFGRFVLSNTAAFRDDRCPWQIRLVHTPFGRFAVQGLNLFVRAATRLTVSRPERMTPQVRAGYLAPYDSWANREGVYRFVCDIPMRPEHPSYGMLDSIERGLAKFRQHPMCFIWGMDDWCFSPRFLDRFLTYFPDAQTHRLSGVGHYVMEDAPEQVIPIVEQFLAGHGVAGRQAG
jgi:haloalkane dehalogenase